MRRVWAILVVAFLLASSPASADWFQAGYDAARTSFTPEDGPTWNDVAFSIQLPAAGPQSYRQAPPVVVGEKAFVAGNLPDGPVVIFEADIPTGDWRRFVEPGFSDATGLFVGTSAKAMASDGKRLFALLTHGILGAWTLDGAEAWPPIALVEPTESQPLGYGVRVCNGGELAVADGKVIAACDTGPRDFGVWSFDARSGALDWSYSWAKDAGWSAEAALADPRLDPSALRSEAAENPLVTGLSVIEDRIVVSGVLASMTTHPRSLLGQANVEELPQPEIASVEDAFFVALDRRASAEGRRDWVHPSFCFGCIGRTNFPPAAVGRDGLVYLETTTLVQRPLDPESTRPSRDVPWRSTPLEGDPASGLALAPEGLYATSLSTLHLFDLDLALLKSYSLPEGQQWGRGAPVRTGNGLVIAPYGPLDGTSRAWTADHGGLLALESRTLRPVWEVPGAVNCTFAVSDGLVVRWCQDGMLTVLGTSASSIQPRAVVPTVYPAVGEEVRVDLGATGAGAFGPPTGYRAVWGDGFETEWQEGPIFTHKYRSVFDAHARFYARNANQTASLPVTFHVGQADPAINIFNSPFADQYQETTFFFLGLLITAIIAMMGIYRAGRKRRLLERELRSLQALKEECGDDDEGLQTRLVERRQRAHHLYMHRKLEDGHLQVLERRIDELTGRARLGRIENECGFLPVTLARSLEGMLRDGRISSRERATFLAAVDDHHALRAGEKAKIHRLVDEWFRHDSGGTP